MNGKVLVTLRANKEVDILDAKLDKNGKLWYQVQPKDSSTVGFVRDYVIDVTSELKIDLPTPTPAPTEVPKAEKTVEPDAQEPSESELDARGLLGKAKTNRDANVREKPVSGAKLVRQLSKGNALNIYAKYQDKDGNIWYEVATESGKTAGFVRDYVLGILEIDKSIETMTYEQPTEE